MYTYTYNLDGVHHEITSQDPIPHANLDNTITISAEQNQLAQHLKHLMCVWAMLAEANGIKWWGGCGTLLGALRDKGLIHYDNDIDLYFHMDDYNKVKQIDCGDKYEITIGEIGFRIHYKGVIYPFVDLWVVAPNPTKISQLVIAGPILNYKPTFGMTPIWSKDVFNVADVATLDYVPYEDLIIPVPKNGVQLCKSMYGDDCMTRYVIYTNSNWHELIDLLPPPKLRMAFLELASDLDKSPTYFGKIIPTLWTIGINQTVGSDKHVRDRAIYMISRHIRERYFGAPSPLGT